MAIGQDEQYTHIAPAPYHLPQYRTSSEMQPSYAYPSPQGQPGEQYRHSPSSSTASLPPVSLPPLRSIDGHAQMSPSQMMPGGVGQAMQHSMPALQYYGHPQGALPLPHAQPLPPYARYAAIPQGPAMAGGRGKKEIKRRTKTGCLTCRKRRIKCDEQHPVCRNCQKSKRECLGYDPIFKQQTGPQALQPAPGTTPSTHHDPNNTSHTASASPTPSSATSGAGAYSPSQASYPSQSHSASYPPFPHPDLSPTQSGGSIDPSLAGSPKAERKIFDHKIVPIQSPDAMDSAKMKPARQLSVDQLFQVAQCGAYELVGNQALDENTLTEIQTYYRSDLAPGLDRLLETDWFSTSGLAKLLATRELCSEVAELLQHFKNISGPNVADAEYRCRATEARAVWHLLELCKPDSASSGDANPSQVDVTAPHGRLDVLDCLLTNRVLAEQSLMPVQPDPKWPRDKTDEFIFWSDLAKFLARRSDDPTVATDVDNLLHQCRNRLNGRENRDVIYSLMITRHLAWRVPGFPHSMHPESGGESSPVNRVYIAHKFIADEAGYRGTNHPIQRICDMAMRSWAIGW